MEKPKTKIVISTFKTGTRIGGLVFFASNFFKLVQLEFLRTEICWRWSMLKKTVNFLASELFEVPWVWFGLFVLTYGTYGICTYAHHLQQKYYVSKMWGQLWFVGSLWNDERNISWKFWKKSWEPFGSYRLSSTANSAQFEWKWAGLAVLFSR